MKLRVLYYTKAGISENMITYLSREYRVKADSIPPAYPMENEKLLIIGTDVAKASPEKPFLDFIRDLKPARAKNVAFFATNAKAAESTKELKSVLAANGVNVAGDTFLCEVASSLFKKGKPTEQNLKDLKDWADKVIASLAE
ncbi:MAG: hypothetical protein SOX72_02195 [Oscillospiraceae bacterium]|nr:hypothetical protein [Oscillospiraceae bacterium]MDY4191013.1 hypothetical protein [Oscillospiraceae bacterium]